MSRKPATPSTGCSCRAAPRSLRGPAGPALAYHRRVSFLRQYLFAIQSFTRVPVTGTLADWVGSSPDMLRASAAHFPGVGWLVGIVACAAFALLGLALPDTPLTPLAAAVGCTVATAWMTGAVHEIGLARTADGLARMQRRRGRWKR